MKRALWVLAFALSAAGCVSASQGSAGSLAGRDPNRITTEEIRGSRMTNAYDLVQSLHSEWLRKRTSTTPMRASGASSAAPDDIVVYLDGQRLGYIESMRSIQATDLAMIRRLSAAEAQQRYGQGHTNGAIELVIRSGGS